LTTVAWTLADEHAAGNVSGPHGARTTYALEGSAFVAGALVQWLRDGLGIIASAAEIEALAASVPDAGGVTIVPALAGLGAPHWRPEARGLISGLTRGTTRAHLARAALEAIALQNVDLVVAMQRDAGRPIERLRVDGGAAANNLLMQLQADLLGTPVERPAMLESTALGAAKLAARALGIAAPEEPAAGAAATVEVFHPRMDAATRATHLARWHDTVAKA
jgi:glycerol kinase